MPRLARNTAVSIVNFVHINEVGPRDGIQNTHAVLSVSERFELIRSLEKSGIQSIEIGSFVSPTAVPSMAGTDELFKQLSNKTNYSVLVPNFKGFTLAQENKVEEICLVLCVTDSMNKKNINKTVDESTIEFKKIIDESIKII